MKAASILMLALGVVVLLFAPSLADHKKKPKLVIPISGYAIEDGSPKEHNLPVLGVEPHEAQKPKTLDQNIQSESITVNKWKPQGPTISPRGPPTTSSPGPLGSPLSTPPKRSNPLRTRPIRFHPRPIRFRPIRFLTPPIRSPPTTIPPRPPRSPLSTPPKRSPPFGSRPIRFRPIRFHTPPIRSPPTTIPPGPPRSPLTIPPKRSPPIRSRTPPKRLRIPPIRLRTPPIRPPPWRFGRRPRGPPRTPLASSTK